MRAKEGTGYKGRAVTPPLDPCPPQERQVEPAPKFKVLVVDDHAVVRKGLVTLINEHPDLEVSGDAGNESDAVLAFRQNVPDLLLVDWSLKQRDSLGLIVTLVRESPRLKILVLSIHDEMTHADIAISSGARGYIMKREAAEKIIDGIRTVLAGAFFLSQRALSGLSAESLRKVSGTDIITGHEPTRPSSEFQEPFAHNAISVVIPVYNSRETLASLCDQLVVELSLVHDLQIILVDDGSNDGSARICAQMRDRYPSCIEYIQLSRNFGEHNALMAGIKHATGDYCVLMDDDLQNPPSEVKLLLRQASKGFDLVYAQYRKRSHPLYRRLGSLLQNWTAGLVLGKPRGLYLSSFKAFNARVVREVSRHSGPEPYLDALLLKATSNIGTAESQHLERTAGRSGYTWLKLVGLWCRLLVGFSVWPVRVVAFVAVLANTASVWQHSQSDLDWASWFTQSLLICLLALVGEYVGRIHMRLNAAPQFVIKARGLRVPVNLNAVQAEMDSPTRHEAI